MIYKFFNCHAAKIVHFSEYTNYFRRFYEKDTVCNGGMVLLLFYVRNNDMSHKGQDIL